MIYQADLNEVKFFLLNKLSSVLVPDKFSELLYLLSELKDKQQPVALYMSFSKTVRLFGKNYIEYSAAESAQAGQIRKDWIPPSSIDKAIRLLLLLETPHIHPQQFYDILENLFDTADVGELVALYGALPVLPYPEQFIIRCTEGIRSNMGEVFEAIANNNPYPADFLNEEAFNQMVLKCLFVGKPLYLVVNLNERLNPKLAQMALDYANERFAALRKVNPELWQLVAPWTRPQDMHDIERIIWTGDDFDRQAAALLCSVSNLTEAKNFYATSNYRQAIEKGDLTWHTLGVSAWQSNRLSAV